MIVLSRSKNAAVRAGAVGRSGTGTAPSIGRSKSGRPRACPTRRLFAKPPPRVHPGVASPRETPVVPAHPPRAGTAIDGPRSPPRRGPSHVPGRSGPRLSAVQPRSWAARHPQPRSVPRLSTDRRARLDPGAGPGEPEGHPLAPEDPWPTTVTSSPTTCRPTPAARRPAGSPCGGRPAPGGAWAWWAAAAAPGRRPWLRRSRSPRPPRRGRRCSTSTPLGGGLDLLLGLEDAAGLRWPALASAGGRLSSGALAAALPEVSGVAVLSWDCGDLLGVPPEAVRAVVDAAVRGFDVVVLDLPRRLDPSVVPALAACDLVLVVVPAEVRAVAAASRVVQVISAHARELRVVVRGPAPSGLTAPGVAEHLDLPLAGRLRPEPNLHRHSGAGSPTGRHRPWSVGSAGSRAARRPAGGSCGGGMTMLDMVSRVADRLAQRGEAATPATVLAALRAEGSLATGPAVLELLQAVRAELVGAGPLEPLLADECVSDVLVNGPAEVWVDRGDGLERAEVELADEAAVRRLAQRLAGTAGRRLDVASPMVDARLRDGTRLHAVLPPVSPAGTLINLRVPRRTAFSLEELLERATLVPVVSDVLRAVVVRAALLRRHRRHRHGQDDVAVDPAVRGRPAGADRAGRGRRRAPAAPPARGAAGGSRPQRGGAGRGRPADPGATGAADAAGPPGGGRGARRRGGRAARGAQHRARRRVRHGARQHGRRPARPGRGAGVPRRACRGRRRTASSPPASTSSCTSPVTAPGAGGSARWAR